MNGYFPSRFPIILCISHFSRACYKANLFTGFNETRPVVGECLPE